MARISIDVKAGKIEEKSFIVGIDLGTTNSLVALVDKESQHPIALPGGKNEGVIVPSLVYFSDTGNFMVGEEVKEKLISEPEHTFYSVKRLMGKAFGDLSNHAQLFAYRIIDEGEDKLVKIESDGNYFSPIQLSAEILKALKQRAEYYLKGKVEKAVITVPAYFNDAQRQATRDAGKLAGLEVLRIVNEPTAASLAYGIGTNMDEEKKVAVYDLGGGTFDLSVLSIHQGVFEVLSTQGNTYLGGDDFDRTIVEYWLSQHQLDANKLSKSQIQGLRIAAEEAKKQLSDHASFSTFEKETQKELKLDLEQFESLISPIVEETLAHCKKALKDAEVPISEIDEVVMVGGSTRVPLVRTKVSEFFNGKSLHTELNPDEVVALGAAVEADILSGNRKDILLLDVTPLSLGIETMGGVMDVLIPRNAKIPVKAGRQYTTSIDGQANMRISVFQGERDLVQHNRKLAEFELKGIPAMPAGLAKVEVSFVLDADGILNVTAKEIRSGVQQEVQVKPQYGLTDQEVEEMLLASIKNANQDIEARALIEIKTEAEQMIYVTENFIKKNGKVLSIEEINQAESLMKKLKDVIVKDDKNAIETGVDQLNTYTTPFAQRVMDAAIGSALKGKKIGEE